MRWATLWQEVKAESEWRKLEKYQMCWCSLWRQHPGGDREDEIILQLMQQMRLLQPASSSLVSTRRSSQLLTANNYKMFQTEPPNTLWSLIEVSPNMMSVIKPPSPPHLVPPPPQLERRMKDDIMVGFCSDVTADVRIFCRRLWCVRVWTQPAHRQTRNNSHHISSLSPKPCTPHTHPRLPPTCMDFFFFFFFFPSAVWKSFILKALLL